MNAIPAVSDTDTAHVYDARVGGKTRKSKAPAWAEALEAHVKASPEASWSAIAAKLDKTEGGVRHWRNGTREIKLSEFVELCIAAGASPSAILGGTSQPGGSMSVDMLPAKEGLLLEIFRGLTPEQQRESTIKMMALVEANRQVQTRFLDKPIRTFGNEDVEAAFGRVPPPTAKKPRGVVRRKPPTFREEDPE